MTAWLSKHFRFTAIFRGCFVALLLAQPALGLAYTGSLTSDSGGVRGTGHWLDPGPTTIAWVVTQNGDLWTYSYLFTHPRGETSHFILEVSESFTEADLQNAFGDFQSTELGDYTPGPGNPNMPGPIHGVKFDGASGLITRITFESPRAPVWGDFYAKDGVALGFNTAWNAGLYSDDISGAYDTDPTDPPSDGSVDNHILVPDTQAVPSQACCFPDGRCELLLEGDCTAQGGSPQGAGTDCDPNECPQPPPLGACCFADGTCQDLSEQDCAQVLGSWQGSGTDCDPNECPQPPPLGACCFADGTCQDLSEQDCAQVLGTWLGSGTDCDPNECTQPLVLGSCCLPNGNCMVLTEDECQQAGGIEWIESGTCEAPNACAAVATERSSWGQIKTSFR